MVDTKTLVVGVAIAAAVSLTLAAIAVVLCGIFCPPLVIAAVPAFFKFAAVFFGVAAAVLFGLEMFKVATYAWGSKTTPNPAAAPPAPNP